MKRSTLALLAALSGISGMASVSTAAADYPSRPITLVAPAGVGGGFDAAVRILAQGISSQTGAKVIVENRVGAGGLLGSGYVAKATPDGYTLLLSSSSLLIAQAVYRKVPFDSERSFSHIAIFSKYPSVLIGNLENASKTLNEVVSRAKAEPDRVTYSTAGVGTATHLVAEILAQRAGITWRHVPYKGAAPAITDLIGGQVDLSMQGVPASYSMIKSGRVKALAVTSRERWPDLPDVPTVSEFYPGFESETWLAISAPAGTPQAIVDKWEGWIKNVVADPVFDAAIRKTGSRGAFMGSKELTRLVSDEMRAFSEAVERGNIQPD